MIHSTIDIHLFAEILLLAWAVWKLIEKNQLFILPQISEAFIDQNPINPGLYGLTIAQGIRMADRLHHRILHDIQRGVPIMGIGKRQAVQGRLVFINKIRDQRLLLAQGGRPPLFCQPMSSFTFFCAAEESSAMQSATILPLRSTTALLSFVISAGA